MQDNFYKKIKVCKEYGCNLFKNLHINNLYKYTTHKDDTAKEITIKISLITHLI